jgi:hypothetical protein
VNRVRLERTRQFGACFLGWELWKHLGLDRFFERAVDGDPAEVSWSRVAAVANRKLALERAKGGLGRRRSDALRRRT